MIPLIDTSVAEQIRDNIASILATASVQQQALAVAAGKDPALYTYRVFVEHSNPWDLFVDTPDEVSPIVNVSLDITNYDAGKSNLDTQQQGRSRFIVDVIALGKSVATIGGHDSGDELSAIGSQRVSSIIRSVLMHGDNRDLGLQGLVGRRFVSEAASFYATELGAQCIRGMRLVVLVDHPEFSPLADEDLCEIVNIKVHFTPTGKVEAEMQYEEVI